MSDPALLLLLRRDSKGRFEIPETASGTWDT